MLRLFDMWHESHCVAVVDIGTSSAAVSVLSIKHLAPSTILAQQRIFLNQSVDRANASAAIASLVREAGTKVKTMLAHRPDGHSYHPQRAFIFARAPWSHSTTKNNVEHFDEDIKITAQEIESHSKNILGHLTDIDTGKLLEASVTRVEINGYPTPDPLGKSGHILGTTILASDIDTAFKDAVTEAVLGLFPKSRPEWRTHTRALLALLREHQHNFSDALIADIGSEASDFIVIRDGVIFQQASMSEGANAILARIASKNMPEETLSLLRMFERDQCSTAACEALKEGLSRAEIALVKVFGQEFTSMALVGRLPTKMLLFTIPDMAPWLARFFSRIDFSQFTITAQPFSPSVITAHNVAQWVITEGGVATDVSLALACTLVHIEHAAPKLK